MHTDGMRLGDIASTVDHGPVCVPHGSLRHE